MSIFTINKKKRNIKELDSDKNVDVLIIGGGITGMTSAYFLKDNKNICVVDANLIGHGVTLNSTAKINYNNAVTYLNSQRNAIKLLKDIIEKENIDCNFNKVPSYLFASSIEEIDVLEKEIKFLKRNNIDIKEGKIPIKTPSYKSYYVEDTYIFNPIKYIEGLYDILINKNINI